jgi:tRNA modification GTPase
MLSDLQDTIVALSSTPGPGRRAIVRLSGPRALAIAKQVFLSAEPLPPGRRGLYSGRLDLPGLASPLHADLYYWPCPRSYTGQEMVELHTISCPPLVELLIGQLLDGGACAAQRGEFTLRAFLGGKLDLTRAEAVLGVIEAGSRDELQQALAQLAGGMERPLQKLRESLIDLLADVEAGLDFADEDIHFVGRKELLDRLSQALAEITHLQGQLDRRALSDRPFRVVLAGRPNAGKSSLFNALTGAPAALVSAEAGTTRDYLVRRMRIDDVVVELVDTAGCPTALAESTPSRDTIDEQAQTLGRKQAEHADLVVWCMEGGRPETEDDRSQLATKGIPEVLVIATKCDLGEPIMDILATSSLSGRGLDSVRLVMAQRARAALRPGLAPSLSRCRHHLEALREHLDHAHGAVIHDKPAELLALELRGALDELGEMVGAVYTDDLLDRIFSRFCIGK